jgi:hypothetical protein
MRYADLGPSTQVLLISLLAVAWAAFLTRTGIFIRRKYARTQPFLPQVWGGAQRRALECFRLLAGFALLALWGSFLFLAPSMATNWPFGYLEVLSLIALLLLNDAWLLLITPRDWRWLGTFSRSFSVTIVFLFLWWASMITATGWLLAKASAAPPRISVPPVGVFAGSAVPCGREIVG